VLAALLLPRVISTITVVLETETASVVAGMELDAVDDVDVGSVVGNELVGI
jgi:hypothetical protein